MFGLVRLRIQLWRETVGTTVTAPRFAAALSEHPVASQRGRRGRGRGARAFGGDEPDLLVLLRLAALRRRDGRPHVRARATSSNRGDARRHRGRRRRRRPRGRGRRPACRCSRPRAPTPRSRRSSLDVETHARRRRDHGLARSRRTTRRPCSCSPIRSASRSTASSRRLARGPSRPPGDRRRGVGGTGPGRQPARARRAHRRRPARSACSSRGSRCGGRVAGLPPGRRALRHHPRRGQPHRGARRALRRSTACRTPRPTRARRTAR